MFPVMILRKNIKYYLIYLLIFLLSASLAAALRFAYGISLVREIPSPAGNGLSFRGYVLFTAEFLKPLLLMLLSAFTIYSCAIGAVASLCAGAQYGLLVIRYGTSGLNPFTHAAVLLFLLAAAAVFTCLSTECALCRNTLRTAAPDPVELLRAKNTQALFRTFLAAAAVTLSFSTALYFFLLYFPI